MEANGAKKLGERLLYEVETEGLSELFNSLRELSLPHARRSVFGIPEIDTLLPQPQQRSPNQAHNQDHQRRDEAAKETDQWILEPMLPPQPDLSKKPDKKSGIVLELVSPPPAHHPSPAGKTSLIYLITAHAILPSSLSRVQLDGKNGAVIIFDPLSHFSVPRLAEVMISHTTTTLTKNGKDVQDESVKKEILDCIQRSLTHVHIFRPASWEGLLATLKAMPEYLFDSSRHRSSDRHIHALILEDIDVFASHIRSASSSSANPATSTTTANPLTAASTRLTAHLSNLSALLSCAVVTTSHSVVPSAFRPALPTSWPQAMHVTRLAVRRVEVVKFAPGLSIEDAENERAQRWEVVSRGRFEAWRIGSGKKGDEGFVFRIGHGVQVETEEGG